MRTRLSRLVLALVVALVACDAGDPPIPTTAPRPPAPEATSAFSVSGGRAWYLIGDALIPGDDQLAVVATGPDARVVDAWLDGQHVARAHDDAGFHLALELQAVAPGEHHVLLAADGADTAFADLQFQRSHPMYVTVSNDWDTGDHADDKLERQDRLHAGHPHLVLTHFVGPYTFTDPTVSAARAQLLVDWVTRYRDTKGDEIGLHIHPYCNFVTTAGVTCRTTPSYGYDADVTGYTVRLGAYTQPELEQMLARAAELFVAHGLGRPTSFRAGGWTATGDVLAALETAGHVTEASGCNWARLEEWSRTFGATLFQWNRANWEPIGDTSQPYYPAVADILADAAPHRTILEAPDNGLLVDYVTTAEMVEMFGKNFDGTALTASRHYSIGYHPINFSEAFFRRIDDALTAIDAHLAAEDRGPVVYARMSDLPRAFPRPGS